MIHQAMTQATVATLLLILRSVVLGSVWLLFLTIDVPVKHVRTVQPNKSIITECVA